MKVAHYSYVLECTHTAVANVPENDTLTAYKKGDSIICPKCQYKKRKITDESKTIGELV